MSAWSARVVLFLLPYSVRDLISGAGLITQQWHQDKNKPTFGLWLSMCIHVSSQTDKLWFDFLTDSRDVIQAQQSFSSYPPICLFCLSFYTWSLWPLYPACPHKSFKHTFNSVNLGSMWWAECAADSVKHRRWRNVKKENPRVEL